MCICNNIPNTIIIATVKISTDIYFNVFIIDSTSWDNLYLDFHDQAVKGIYRCQAVVSTALYL